MIPEMYVAWVVVNVGTMMQAAHAHFMKKGQIMPEAKCSYTLLQGIAAVS